MSRLPALLLACPLAFGCLTEDDGVDCTTLAAASVQLTVSDPSGAAIPGATAEYTVSGEDWTAPEPCEQMPDGTFVCGWEVEDSFQIWVDAEGYGSEYLEADVQSDGCHVITEQLSVTLQPE